MAASVHGSAREQSARAEFNSLRMVSELQNEDEDYKDAIDVDYIQNEALLALELRVKEATLRHKSLKKELRALQQSVVARDKDRDKDLDRRLDTAEALARQQADELRSEIEDAMTRSVAAGEAARAEIARLAADQERAMARLAEQLTVEHNALRKQLDAAAQRSAEREREAREAAHRMGEQLSTHGSLLRSLDDRLASLTQSHDTAHANLRGEIAVVADVATHALSQFTKLQRELRIRFDEVHGAGSRQLSALERRWQADVAERTQREARLSSELTALRGALDEVRVHLPHATCHMPHATCHMPHATCHIPHATCHIPHATCHMHMHMPHSR